MIARYRQCRYVPGGRGPIDVDCYGLARMVRHELFGLPLLPSYSAIHPDDKPSATTAFGEVVAPLVQGEPKPGALALCWAGSLAIHCGVCVELDGRLGVLEADERRGIRWHPLRQFRRLFSRVEFYE